MKIYFSIMVLLCLCSKVDSQNISEILHQNSFSFSKHTLYSEKDSLISSVLAQINADSIMSYMLKLESFNTRYAYAPNRYIVTNWLIDKFKSFGYENVEVDSFLTPKNIWCRNISVALNGRLYPDNLCITGAHYDSYNYSLSDYLAPGADDNASGTAAVLEMARIARLTGFTPNYTMKFITFGAEEAGLLGSKHLAGKYKASGQEIKLMINQDMIANFPSTDSLVKIFNIKGSEAYSRYAGLQTERFTSLINANINNSSGGKSDHYSFGEAGYPAISFQEHSFSPNLHTSKDSVKYCSTEYCAEVTKASFATLLHSSISPEIIRNLRASDIGNGTSIHLRWKPVKDAEHKYYKIGLGRSPSQYDSSFSTIDTSVVISGLIENASYTIEVSSVNSSNLEGISAWTSIIPQSIPLAPRNIEDNPTKENIMITWSKNTEEDLLGYKIYRSVDTSSAYRLLNANPLKDTVYIDRDVADTTYFYKVTAVDNEANESINNNLIKSHAVTLSLGILIVDDTEELPGNRFSDEQIDSFFTAATTGFIKSDFDLKKQKAIRLSDLGKYSIILWHNSLAYYKEKNIDAIKKYLDFGGSFLFTGYRVSDFHKRSSSQYVTPLDYKEGDFIYDYLKIKHIESKASSIFSGAIPAKDYYLSADIDKAKLGNFILTNFESIQPASGASVIYKYNSDYDTSTVYGSMKGMPVGIEYIGSNYKIVLLDFPLFYLKPDMASAIIHYIVENKFGYPTSVTSTTNIPIIDYSLSPNYPNPFNPTTNISCDIPNYSFIKLRVFDILGREISTLFEGYLTSGRHTFTFSARNLTSGIYFYCLSVNGYKYVRKMSLIK